jgi:hypothetical protein
MLTCKDSCIHYPVCKDTIAEENWTDEAPEFLKELYSPKACEHFSPRQKVGTWTYYSTTMMECSICGKHVARHRYKFCPECGSSMTPKIQLRKDESTNWEQLTLFPLHTGGIANE